MKTLIVPIGTTRVAIADVFRLMLDQAKGGQICITLNKEGKTISHTQGGLVFERELQSHFLDFCLHRNVIPISPDAPWRFDYKNIREQNRRYEISLEEFEAFARPYGFAISCTGIVEENSPDSEMPEAGESAESAWDLDLPEIPLNLVAQNKRVSSRLKNRVKELPKRQRFPNEMGEPVVGISPIYAISIPDKNSALDDETEDFEWGGGPASPAGPEGGKLNSSQKLRGRRVKPRAALRDVVVSVPNSEVSLKPKDFNRSEPFGEQSVSSLPNTDADTERANLFDPVRIEDLDNIFPTRKSKQWKQWAERASRNGLIQARVGRAFFNPYLAGKWWLKKGQEGWDLAKLMRKLASRLPARSMDSKHLLTGGIE